MYPDSQSVQRAIWQALRSALALTDAEASASVVRAYTDSPPSEPAASANLVYYHLQTAAQSTILEESSAASHSDPASAVPLASSFIPCSLILVFYGPSSEAWALRCQSFLFLDGKDLPLQILRSVGLYLIPSHTSPSVVFEEVGKTRRKRSDLIIPARLLSNAPYAPAAAPESPIEIPSITTPPAVNVRISRRG